MFKKALPIWLSGLENEKNIQAEFTAKFGRHKNIHLYITGATFFRIYLNGQLLHYGPARTAKGYARVDVISIPDDILTDDNLLKIDAAGYNCNSYAAVMQDSFLQAEIASGSEIIAATGYDFNAFRTNSREQKVMRYSAQRHFTEVWDLNRKRTPYEISILKSDIKYLSRRAPLPDMGELSFENIYTYGEFRYNKDRVMKDYEYKWMERFITGISDIRIGYMPDEIPQKPLYTYRTMEYSLSPKKDKLPITLSKNRFAVIDLGRDHSGMIKLSFKSSPDCRIYIVFDEKIQDDRFAFGEVINIIQLDTAGESEFTSFETYTLKYLSVFVIEGEFELENASVISYKNPLKNPPTLKCNDPEIQGIYNAALETYRQNAVDIYTDCPSRERAGWLCDSYFTAQAEYAFTEKTLVEDDFIENFLLHSCTDIPKGVLPMCYPADHLNGSFIPQWCMWFIIEIEQYAKRNPIFDVNRFKSTAYDFLSFLSDYENDLSLLEDLPGWNFVEWSKANDWTAGVNFPTNMLYSYILKILGNMFNDVNLTEKSQKIKNSVLKLSYRDKFFHDQAIRDENGELNVCPDHISEVCQYYAFRFDIADETTFSSLKNTMLSEFYPESQKYPNIEKANVLMGIYMRLELLLYWGEEKQLVDEICAFFSHMNALTGTLWEHKNGGGSLNHGFASYVGALLLKIFNK